MGNEQKVENIKKLIQSSLILSIPEKEEWLSMVELMNDKQMSELMEILGQPAPAPTPAPAPSIAPGSTPAGIPKLSHLSNLPNTMPQPAPVAPVAVKAPVSAPTPAPAKPAAQAAEPALSPFAGMRAQAPKSAAPAPALRVAPTTTKPSQPVKPALVSTYKPAASNLRSLGDLAALTVADLRAQGVESIISGARNIAVSEGYFAVFENFEHSPLYKEYIRAGERALTGKTIEEKDALTAGEFELVADILQAIRINRS